jgi:hypothetical protein
VCERLFKSFIPSSDPALDILGYSETWLNTQVFHVDIGSYTASEGSLINVNGGVPEDYPYYFHKFGDVCAGLVKRLDSPLCVARRIRPLFLHRSHDAAFASTGTNLSPPGQGILDSTVHHSSVETYANHRSIWLGGRSPKYPHDTFQSSFVGVSLRRGRDYQLTYPSGSQHTVAGHPLRWQTIQAVLDLIAICLGDLSGEFPHSTEVAKRVGFTFICSLRPSLPTAMRTRHFAFSRHGIPIQRTSNLHGIGPESDQTASTQRQTSSPVSRPSAALSRRRPR